MVFDFKGIPKIKIPVELSSLDSKEAELDFLNKYLGYCLSAHNQNAVKIDYLYNFYLGNQDISGKTRTYREDNPNVVNNKDVENHAYAQVEFKKALCNTLQYTHKDGVESTDDLSALGRILTDADFDSKHQEVLEYIFSTGIGTTFSIPKTNIINEDGTYKNGFNIDYEAPFIFEAVNPCVNFNIYSSYIGEDALFSVCIVDKSEISSNNIVGNQIIDRKYQIIVYSRNFFYKYKAGIDYSNIVLEEVKPVAFHFLPLIEYSFNKARIGIVEINRDEYNVINLIISNSADATVDTVNQVIVFENVDITEEQMNEMLACGAIKIKSDISSGMTVGSKVYTLEMKFNHTDINVFYEQRLINSYMIAGCVRAMSNTNSGGTTQSGSQTANGWDNAWLLINKDIKSIRRYDYEQLKLFLEMVRLVPGTTIKDIKASEIEIKYNLNPNDNILSKAQALKYFDEMNMPEEMALQKSGLSMDINEEGRKWRDNKEKQAEKQAEKSKISTSVNGNIAL